MYIIYPVYTTVLLYMKLGERGVNDTGVLAGCKYFVPEDSSDSFDRSRD